MKLIIAGSRTLGGREAWIALKKAIHQHDLEDKITEVVSGTAPGADRLGARYGRKYGIPIREFPANWDLHGRQAGFLRNIRMSMHADAAVILWDGKSRGANHMREQMVRMGKPVITITLEGPLQERPLETEEIQ